jgi:hypothetical protein
MKIFKKILLTVIVLLVISSVGGYFYFNNKFTPPENYLTVKGVSEKIPLKWISSENNPNVAILLPVKLEGISQPFYMQLDFGSPTTLMYSTALKSIQSKFPSVIDSKEDSQRASLRFQLGEMKVSSDTFKVLTYGKVIEWKIEATNIIGTIGTDLLEKRQITLNFKEDYCLFDINENKNGFTAFEFEKRRLLFPAKIGNKNLKLLYDSGTSGYELITNQREWEKYRVKGGKTKSEKANSMGNTLTVISAPAKKTIEIGLTNLNLSEVTYVEGTSTVQNILIRFSGMQGMVGNKLFLNQILIIDCKSEKFKIE